MIPTNFLLHSGPNQVRPGSKLNQNIPSAGLVSQVFTGEFDSIQFKANRPLSRP